MAFLGVYKSLFNKRQARHVILAVFVFVALSALLIYQRRPELPRQKLWPEHEAVPPYRFSTTTDFSPVSMDPARKSTKDLCASFPSHLLATIQPVLKMGHSENHDKLEAQMNSVSACFAPDELLIFSDLAETVGEHKVIDVLEHMPGLYHNATAYGHFAQYLQQKEMQENGTLGVDKEATERIHGWVIDKFKFLPMVEEAWIRKPNRDFYVFYETDTYIFWDSMFRFLKTVDPDLPLYMGSPSPGRRDLKRGDQGTLFANGGPGYVLSRGAIKKLLHRRTGPTGQYIDPPLNERWKDEVLDPECCGDSVLGWVLWQMDVILQGYYPMFTQHILELLPFDDAHWCQPLLTMHKTSPVDMVDMFKWEFEHRQLDRPLTYSDIWHFYHPGKPDDKETRDDWDNQTNNNWKAPATAGIDSADTCEEYCRGEEACLQWNWSGPDTKECVLMRSIKHGWARKPEDRDDARISYTSGWVQHRIEKWRSARKCEVVDWVGPSLERIFR